MDDEERMTQHVRELAAGYNRPPAVPSDALWARISGDVDRVVASYAPAAVTPAVAGAPVVAFAPNPVMVTHHSVHTGRRAWNSTAMGLAFVAVLVVGVVIGRSMVPTGAVGHTATPNRVASSTSAPSQFTPSSTLPSTPTLPSTQSSPVTPPPSSQPSIVGSPKRSPREMLANAPSMLPSAKGHDRNMQSVASSMPASTGNVPPSQGLPPMNGSTSSAFATMANARQDPGSVYDLTTSIHLANAEAFLTSFRADLKVGRVDSQLTQRARDLLLTTRVLYDAPATRDPQLKTLLADLELVLIQIAGNQSPRPADLELARQALDQSHILSRLREVTN